MIKTTTTEAKDLVKDNDIIDVDLSVIKKKKFRINGDNNLIIELNPSDMNIIARLNDATPKLESLQRKALKLSSDKDIDLSSTAKLLKEVDDEMRELVDYIFNADVSSKCAADGSMYDPMGGMYRYEHILDKLMKLYEDNLAEEYKRMKVRINKYAKTTPTGGTKKKR